MSFIIDFLILSACGAVLWWAANLIVTAASHIAHRLGLSDLVVGLTVVAFGTSIPEFGVTIAAALTNHGDISISNVTGSNIINLGFVLGFVALIRAIKTSRSVVKRDGIILILATILLYVFLLDYQLSHWEGVIFCTILIIYNIYLIKNNKSTSEEIDRGSFKLLDIGKLVLGISLITISSHFLVGSAVNIAGFFGLSEWVIGQTIIALGTSIPELATSLAASIRGRHGMSVGNLIGSNLFNILGVLGVSSIIRTVVIDQSALVNLYILIGFTVMVVLFMFTGRKVSRTEGFILVLANLAIWALSFMGMIG